MKIRKKTVLSIFVVVTFIVAITISLLFVQSINDAWKEVDSWTAEDIISLPQKTDGLKITLDVANSNSKQEKNLKFKTDYCYLYSIVPSEDKDSVEISCSLLPLYYAERELEVPKDWEEVNDIKIVINKNDPSPTEFLGRQDKSFDSVSSLGSKNLPVSIEIVGKYIYPEETLANKFRHWKKTRTNDKSTIEFKLEGFSIKRLDNVGDEYVHTFATKWVKDIRVETDNILHVNENLEGQKLLNAFGDFFTYKSAICKGLTGCEKDYEGNPSASFSYYLYSINSSKVPYISSIDKALTSYLYPFNAKERPSDDPTDDWGVFSVFEFPICPIRSIGKKNTFVIDFFKSYMLKSEIDNFSEDMPHTAIKWEDKWSQDYAQYYIWNPEIVYDIDKLCFLAFSNKLSLSELHSLENAYYSLADATLGIESSSDKKSLERYIYESSAFSPYKTNLLTDRILQRSREDSRFDTNESSASRYVEWRSVLNTYLVLYLYEN